MFVKVKGAYDPSSVNGEYCLDFILNTKHIILLIKKAKENVWSITLIGGNKIYVSEQEVLKIPDIYSSSFRMIPPNPDTDTQGQQ